MKGFLKTLLAAFIGTLVALFMCGFILFGIIGSIAALSEEVTPVVPSNAILRIDSSMPVTEQSSDDPFASLTAFDFGKETKTTGILTIVRAIDQATTDPSIKFIYLNCKGLNIGISQLEEVREALARFRTSGKAVIAYGDNFSQAEYYLASAADKIYINQEGMAMFTGLGINMMFFKDLLEKIGVDVQLIRHGKFKAAAEQFIANNISKENLEQNQVMIDAIWGTWVNAIGKSREISPDTFNMLVNDLKLGLPQTLTENNLVDGVVTRAEMTEQLCTLSGVKKEKELKIISLQNYAKAAVKSNMKAKSKIAVIYANGEITMSGDGLSVKKFYPIISKIRQDSSIKGVVLRVNSPGGDAQAAEIINNELQLLRKNKPLVVSMGDYAASGGYWISAQSERIFADNTTITGSIGVFSLYASLGNAAKKHLDINTVNISTNKHSSMMNGMTPLDAAEIAYMQTFVEKIYNQFTNLVATGRNLPVSYVDSIGQGRVWAGTNAIELKLADEQGGLMDAINYTAKLAGLQEYRINEYPTVKSSLEKLMETLSNTESNAKILANPISILETTYSSLKDQTGIHTYTRIPYLYEFNY